MNILKNIIRNLMSHRKFIKKFNAEFMIKAYNV